MKFTKAVVKALLEHATEHTWTLQGFGMLRLHLSDEVRLNVWDSRYRVRDVSLIHDHPWDFSSLVVVGTLVNHRYIEPSDRTSGRQFHCGTIKPGPGGGLDKKTVRYMRIIHQGGELYHAGDSYEQTAKEIHKSMPDDGTVTLNIRKRKGADEARVFWELGTEWVSAEPRRAEAHEILDITRAALRGWQ